MRPELLTRVDDKPENLQKTMQGGVGSRICFEVPHPDEERADPLVNWDSNHGRGKMGCGTWIRRS